MARFRFELQSVLEQREREERARQRVVAELERERVSIEGEIRSCRELAMSESSDLRARLVPGEAVDLDAVRVQASASLGVLARAQAAVVRLAGVYERLDRARLELLEAATARRAVELLRDRRLEAWKRDELRREQLVLDDLTNAARFGGGREGGGAGSASLIGGER
ncbi:MAG: flagellar FliJ family protein [Planctomycetota bacterium]